MKKIQKFLFDNIKNDNYNWRITDIDLLIWDKGGRMILNGDFGEGKDFLNNLNEVCSFPLVERGNDYIYFNVYGDKYGLKPFEIQAIINYSKL